MEKMALPQISKRLDKLGSVSSSLRTLPSSASIDRTDCDLTVANLFLEEPDALIGHVRICEGLGWVTVQVYPTSNLLE